MAIIFEDEDLNTTQKGENEYQEWEVDELKDDMEKVAEGKEEKDIEGGLNEEDISMEVSDDELLDGDIGDDGVDDYSDEEPIEECDNSPNSSKTVTEDYEIVDEEFDPDSMFIFSEEGKADDEDDDSEKEDDSKKDDDKKDDDTALDDDSSDDDEDADSEEEDDEEEDKEDDSDDDKKKSSKKTTNEDAFMFFEDGELVMSDDDLEGVKDMESDDADSADDVTIDELNDEVESVAEDWDFFNEGEKACGKGSLTQPESYDSDDVETPYWKNQKLNEGDNGEDGIPDPDYFEGEGGTANPNYKDDGKVDLIDTRPALPGIQGPIEGKAPMEEEYYGLILKRGLCLKEENVNIIASSGKYFVTEDDLSMVSNYYDNALSTNTLLKKIAESNDIPLKDLFVYHATDHILVEAKKAATMNKKATKNSMKKRIKAIDQQIKAKKAKGKTTNKLKLEKKNLKELAK